MYTVILINLKLYIRETARNYTDSCMFRSTCSENETYPRIEKKHDCNAVKFIINVYRKSVSEHISPHYNHVYIFIYDELTSLQTKIPQISPELYSEQRRGAYPICIARVCSIIHAAMAAALAKSIHRTHLRLYKETLNTIKY